MKFGYITKTLIGICFLHLPYSWAAPSEAYKWQAVAMGGGGFVSAVIPSKTEQNLVYARTDVGGAYRWSQADQRWIPLNDWVSDQETGILGVESIALDPQHSERLYMLAGISYFNGGKTYFLRSNDYGQTFAITDVTNQFKAHGNGMGRQTGEKIQVDPADSNILYVGTRYNGLFKSTDAGSSFSRVSSLDVTTTLNENGISFVLLDPSSVSGGLAQRIIVGVSRYPTAGANMYISQDAGNSFTAVTGGPSGLMPSRAVLSDGHLIIVYANGAGPHGHWAQPEPMDQGQIWKYKLSDATWTNISPAGFTRAFGGISVDPANSQRLILSSINTYLQQGDAWGDRLFLSTNGGTSWVDLVDRGFTEDSNGVSWINGHSIHWAGSFEFDPFNTKRVWVTSGNGIFSNADIDQATSPWRFDVTGLEETVPLNIVSVEGGPLLTVIGDYDGFRNTDPSQYAPIHTPRMGTTTGLAVAAQAPQYVARAGSDIYVSSDSGVNWSKTAVINGEKGQLAFSADGGVLLHAPEGSSITYRSTNLGASWTAVTGLSVSSAYPNADPVNSNKFYALNGTSMMVSTNGGVSFAQAGAVPAGGSKIIRLAPGREGDIWVALYDGGLTRSTNSGTSFSKLTNVTYAGAVGFGKAAPGAGYPSIYIWGTVDGVRGVYRSVDQGSNWVRVNDDNHEFGGPGNGQFVVGDMNRYGFVYMSTAGRGVVYGEPSDELVSSSSSSSSSETASSHSSSSSVLMSSSSEASSSISSSSVSSSAVSSSRVSVSSSSRASGGGGGGAIHWWLLIVLLALFVRRAKV